jgi:hypothetical protein
VAPVSPWLTEAQLASFAADSYLLLPRWLTLSLAFVFGTH